MTGATRIVRPGTAFSKAPVKGQRRPRVHADTHLRWIRTLPCVLTGTRPVEAAHIRFAEPRYGKRETGMSEKPDDRWALPLSPDKHREQHSMNEREFWRKHGVDPCAVALALWAETGNDDIAMSILSETRGQVNAFVRRQAAEVILKEVRS